MDVICLTITCLFEHYYFGSSTFKRDCSSLHSKHLFYRCYSLNDFYPIYRHSYLPLSLLSPCSFLLFLPLHPSTSFLLRWTGSNTNPNNNDGQGKAGTDRSNIVLLTGQNYPEGTPGVAVPIGEKFGHWGNSYPANLNSNSTFLGLTLRDREILAMLSNGKETRGSSLGQPSLPITEKTNV